MSFKSKQRAKHGLLFGDDPLNAISTTSMPTIKAINKTPIPSSSTTTRSKSNTTSRPSSLFDPLSQSTSSFGITQNNTQSLNSGSIFGGIDVSKFGNKRNNPRPSTTLRPSPSLKTSLADSNGKEDDIDHLLFGDGGRRKTSTSSSLVAAATKKSTSSSLLPNGYSNTNGTILIPTPLSSSSGATTLQQSSAPPDTLTTPSKDIISTQPINKVVPSLTDNENIKTPPPLPPARRPTSSISKTSISPLVSSSTSSLSSFSSTTTTSTSTNSSSSSSSSPVMTNTQSCPPPPPPRTHKKHLQQQDASRQLESSSTQDDRVKTIESQRPSVMIEDDETRRMQQQREAMMEDEGTRAFAGTITPSLKTTSYHDDPELCSSITQSLTISPHTTGNANPWAPPAFLPPIDKDEPEIEPAKRAAFADLIAHWHGEKPKEVAQNPDEQFYNHVACEQRDIGFAGIETRAVPTSFYWQQEPLTDDNPWSC